MDSTSNENGSDDGVITVRFPAGQAQHFPSPKLPDPQRPTQPATQKVPRAYPSGGGGESGPERDANRLPPYTAKCVNYSWR